MVTPQEQRNIRLKNDYSEMANIRGPIVQWRAVRGTPPYVEEYELTVKVRTIISPRPEYRDTHTIQLRLPARYPFDPPEAVMTSTPQPFHPNWFVNGRWCSGSSWEISEGLGHFVVRLLRTLQFDAEITNPDSAANGAANTWYLANRNRGLFPPDRQVLPDPTRARFEIVDRPVKTFRIE